MGSGVIDTIVWVAIFFIFSYLYPKFLLAQMISKLEDAASKFEEADRQARKRFLKKLGLRGKKYDSMVEDFQEMFVVMPSSLDPFGVVKKIDATLRQMEGKFERFALKLESPGKRNVNYALRALVSVHQISKVVRHYVELVKKYKNIQIGFLVQMQLPAIREIFNSEIKGVDAFISKLPVGDSIGPLLAASYMKKPKDIAQGIVMDRARIAGRDVVVLKAKGPDPELGRMDEALKKLVRRGEIAKVITVDAALKLQGEKTGKVAEGVGFAMGGISQREIIENILLPKNIPVDAVVCKIDMSEGIAPMTKDIYNALPKLRAKVEEIISDTNQKGTIILIGVGNTTGVGNSQEWVEKVGKVVRKISKSSGKEKK